MVSAILTHVFTCFSYLFVKEQPSIDTIDEQPEYEQQGSTLVEHPLKHPPATYLVYKGDFTFAIMYVTPEKVLTDSENELTDGRGELHVHIKSARNLSSVRANGFSDPFCKAYLLPDKRRKQKQKTTVQRRNCNPDWDFELKFDDISPEELQERCLELTIWDYDRVGSNQFLGGVRLNTGTGTHFGEPVYWMDARGDEINTWKSFLLNPNQWVEATIQLRPNMDQRK